MHIYGLIIGISIALGLSYFQKHNHLIPKKSEKFFIIGLIITNILGARIYHVLDHWIFYSQNILEIFQTWHGGLGIFGAIIFALIYIFIFSRLIHISYLPILNSITPILPLTQAIGRLGNWVNQENPFWWQESLLDLLLFLIIHRFPKNPTAKYLFGYGAIRLATDTFRQDIWIINQFKISQLFGIIFILLGLCIYFYETRIQISKTNFSKRSLGP
ncbi:MAG: prolipoprotein diacylglyceryl transferase family protein [Candidatus Shapirobacteria bacterium]